MNVFVVLRALALTAFALIALAGDPRTSAQGNDQTLALKGAKLYTSPEAHPIEDGVVLIRGGKITAVGTAKSVLIPAGAKLLDCSGSSITAGFQNSHVHFTEAKWNAAATQPAAQLAENLSDMLTRFGFTTVVDLASSLANTSALRARVVSGEVPGPRILTAGGAVYPPTGTPYYLRDTLPPIALKYIETVEEPATPEAARKLVLAEINGGADVVKLFVGALVGPGEVKLMDPDVTAAAVAEAHQHGRLVFVHPSNLAGATIAIDAGVDVLAHATPMSGKWDDAFVSKMKMHNVSLIPTLTLWGYELRKAGETPAEIERYDSVAASQVLQYQRAGGQLLFGTDVGYTTVYDTTEEFRLLSQAGLTSMRILAMLTTAPAARFGESATRGTIAPGMDGDLVVLSGDPAQDARNFAKVRYTIRAGRVIYPVPSN